MSITRIDCVPVTELTDQHLLSNYREITRVSKAARYPKKGEPWPEHYCMGAGHVKFFYDKGSFLCWRTVELYNELCKRGFNVKQKLYRPHPEGLNNHWFPSDIDREVCRARIAERIASNPSFYSFYGQKIKKGEVS